MDFSIVWMLGEKFGVVGCVLCEVIDTPVVGVGGNNWFN